MKKLFTKKLFAFIIVTMMFSLNANGQIVYTDVIPDTSVSIYVNNGAYNLDLNNDGIIDFQIAKYGYAQRCEYGGFHGVIVIQVSALNSSNRILVDTIGHAMKLDSLTWIGSSQFLWSDTAYSLIKSYFQNCLNMGSYAGSWNNGTGYLGLKFFSGSDAYYGWVRISVNITAMPNGNFHGGLAIKDYAFNSIPNQPILAGQTTTTGINDISFQEAISIYPNPATNSITIKFPSDEEGEISIVNLFGEIVLSEKINSEEKQIDVNKFSGGMYVVRWSSGENFEMKKFSVVK